MYSLEAQVGLIHGSGFDTVEGIQRISEDSRFNAERAAQLLAEGRIEHAICSGRGPITGVTYPLSEAELMADELLSYGIHPSKIEIEETSTSAVGNWVHSVPIIQALKAETVLGITGGVNVRRMYRIGEFVAARSDFKTVGYAPSDAKAHIKDYIRELGVDIMTRRFLATEQDCAVDQLDEAYEAYKARSGMSAIKKFLHR